MDSKKRRRRLSVFSVERGMAGWRGGGENGSQQEMGVSHLNKRFIHFEGDDDELMLNVLRCHETY